MNTNESSELSLIAIVGRPNVGKSTIFNRLLGQRAAIESEIAGTTRDRLMHAIEIENYPALLVDTGGLELNGEEGEIEASVQKQSLIAIDGADLILFVIDARDQLTLEDFHAVDILRRSNKKVILIANKCDNRKIADNVLQFFELGFGEPITMSAIHSSGFQDLRDRLFAELKAMDAPIKKIRDEIEPADDIKISFLGRPNVGKSTMINALFGKERLICSSVPGTTRDSAHLPFSYEDQNFTLIDTAGIRRRGKIEKGIEKYSILRTMQSLLESEICVLLLDFEEGITSQDCHVSQFILENKKGLILVVNKIDILPLDEREAAKEQFIRVMRKKMAYVPWAPVVFSSAIESRNIFPILDLCKEIHGQRNRIIPQESLNIWLDHVLAKHPPKGRQGKRVLRVHAVRQKENLAPFFIFNCEWPELMHFSYARFLENEIRKQFGFKGTSIELQFKGLK